MVDDVKDNLEIAENKVSAEISERAQLARERREAEQRRRLDELRAHAAAAQAQRERRDEERRRRQDEQRSRDCDRRVQVEERKRAIWEASVSRREALLQRERDREERLERARQARSTPRSAFAFGSSTPRLLEPADTSGFFYAARRASSTSNVMFASAPLTRRASALHLDMCDNDSKDESDRQPQMTWNSVARRRTDLVPTMPAPRAPEGRSGDVTPSSRPGSAMSATPQPPPRRPHTAPRRPRPASIAGTGVNTPRGIAEGPQSAVTTPSVSRDGSCAAMTPVPRRAPATPRRPRPASMHIMAPATPPHKPALTPGEGKPPLHRKPKLPKDHDKSPRGAGVKARSVSPGPSSISVSPSPVTSKESSVDKDIVNKKALLAKDNNPVSATEVSQKLEALQIRNQVAAGGADKVNEKQPISKIEDIEINSKVDETSIVEISTSVDIQKDLDIPKIVETHQLIDVQKEEEREEKKDVFLERPEDSEMTASMTARRITTEEQAKAALAERRRKAREELERQAELERQRLQKEAEQEIERQRIDEERQKREEEEAKELAALQRRMEEEKLRKAIEAQQQLEREEAERKVREEVEKQARVKEDEEKRKALEEAEKLRKEEAEKEEKERIARKQRVEAIMARTRRKAEEDKKEDSKVESSSPPNQSVESSPAPIHARGGAGDNGNPGPVTANNGNHGAHTEDLLGLSNSDEKVGEQTTKSSQNDNTQQPEPTNNGNLSHIPPLPSQVGHMTANFIQTERNVAELNQATKEMQKMDGAGDFTTHNGHGTNHTHPLTLQNAI